jgi:hypothetical protein
MSDVVRLQCSIPKGGPSAAFFIARAGGERSFVPDSGTEGNALSQSRGAPALTALLTGGSPEGST